MQQNDLIFRGLPVSPVDCFRQFKMEFALVILKAKAQHKLVVEWLDSLM